MTTEAARPRDFIGELAWEPSVNVAHMESKSTTAS